MIPEDTARRLAEDWYTDPYPDGIPCPRLRELVAAALRECREQALLEAVAAVETAAYSLRRRKGSLTDNDLTECLSVLRSMLWEVWDVQGVERPRDWRQECRTQALQEAEDAILALPCADQWVRQEVPEAVRCLKEQE